MLKKSIIRPICGYCNECKNKQLFIKLICEYYNWSKKTINYLQNLYVGIAYLKWHYGNYDGKNVGITQCSFWSL